MVAESLREEQHAGHIEQIHRVVAMHEREETMAYNKHVEGLKANVSDGKNFNSFKSKEENF